MKRFGHRGALTALQVAAVLALLVVAVGAEAKVLHGTQHRDRLRGTNHSDRIFGRKGADKLIGRGDSDKLLGGKGADVLRGGRGFDVMLGGRGNDRINARDGHRDRIDCGNGHDKVIVDRIEDGVRNCEKVVQPR